MEGVPETMRAVLVREWGAELGALAAEDGVRVPATAPGEALVRVLASGVNPVDTYIRTGTYAVKPQLPYTPGKDGAGVVVSVNAEGASVRPGDRVYISGASTGTLAEYCACPLASLVQLPSRLTMEQGATLGVPLQTAYRALFRRCGVKAGDRILVHGASGGVGLAATSLARRAGCRVAGTASTPAGEALARAAGCEAVAPHNDLKALRLALTADGAGGEAPGFDVALEMLANATLGATLPHMAKSGRVGIIGSRGVAEGAAVVNPRDIMARELDVRGVMLGCATAEERAEANAAAAAGIADGTFTPAVGSLFVGLDAAGLAHVEVIHKGSGAGGTYSMCTRASGLTRLLTRQLFQIDVSRASPLTLSSPRAFAHHHAWTALTDRTGRAIYLGAS